MATAISENDPPTNNTMSSTTESSMMPVKNAEEQDEHSQGRLLTALDLWKPSGANEDRPIDNTPSTQKILPPPIDTQVTSATSSNDAGFPFHEAGSHAPEPTNLLINHAYMPPIEEVSTYDEDGHAAIRERPNVQFAAEDTEIPPPDRPRNSDAAARRAESFINRVKALGHSRRSSAIASDPIAEEPSTATPPVQEQGFRSIIRDRPRSFAAEGDADAEDSQTDDLASGSRAVRRRPFRRHTSDEGTTTAEITPRPVRQTDSFASSADSGTSPSRFRRFGARRANTLADVAEHRQGLSEDEGRERLARHPNWRQRSSAWVVRHRDSAPNAARRTSTQDDTRDGVRPGHTSGNTSSDGRPSQWRRGTTAGAQRWRQIKASIKMIGQQKRREEARIDQAKSAELMAELLAGSPAALILASHFQRDESDQKKVPVLLEQLKIRITDGTNPKGANESERHVVFKIELEYGSGLMRMKWVIYRTLGDFVNLHTRCKLLSQKEKVLLRGGKDDPSRVKMPHFPRSAFPYLRGLRGLADDSDEEEETGEDTGTEGLGGATRRPKQKRRGSSLNRMNRLSSPHSLANTPSHGEGENQTIDGVVSSDVRRQYANRQRKKLEDYLYQLIRFLRFREGSNRLCKFLELSALGVRLAAESTYHGKEGYLTLQSAKGLDFRKAWKPNLIVQRHKPMWFLVRHSYLVCVNSLEDMNIYDVFLVDADFKVEARRPRARDQKSTKKAAETITTNVKVAAAHPQKHVLRVQNAERKLRLIARKEAHLTQFEESLIVMQKSTDWSKKHRFDSFAPIRQNVFAQWLVDGRDYMWNVSRAISMAQDVIYIHDWWLSPEIYMRRPAAISHKWRLDRLLKRKAEEGVKIFVIVYRNINSAIPIDSEYTKFSLLDLHPNVFVQRSPNQFRQNTFFWAHHEKICVVDHTVAFCGGVDLCFGRWDTPQHSVVDDKFTGFERKDMPLDSDHCQLFPGKDYSNPRVLDFFKLDEPYGEMYDRTKVPRMPWHDIGMQIVGQPARDLTRHFIQRWNYILRQRKPSRPTPFLLPPPDFAPGELEAMGLDGTCDVQMLRSACDWSIGTPGKVEHSIMNAYVKLIETSDHFVYIENQFFISSCTVDGDKIRNHLGDAIVERAIRAYRNGEHWKCVVVIPLMPGFQNTVEAQDGTSVRLIMQFQYRSIDRGETSIFGRLRAEGIDPLNYVRFYSLRAWGKIGPQKSLVTEQLYIHAKVMVVDDRYAIIGSANINERSMLGERDSEIAAVIYDNDLIDSRMGGKDYKVGRFPHTLRMRLMREHLGVDVDHVMDDEREAEMYDSPSDSETGSVISSAQTDKSVERKLVASRTRIQDDLIAKAEGIRSFNHDIDWEQADNPNIQANKKLTQDHRVTGNATHRADVEGRGFDNMVAFDGTKEFSGRDSSVLKHNKEVLVNNVAPEGKGTLETPQPKDKNHAHQGGIADDDDDSATTLAAIMPPSQLPRLDTVALGLTLQSQLPPLPVADDTDIGGPGLERTFSHGSSEFVNPMLAQMHWPQVTKDCMQDPLADNFFFNTWNTVAQNNTKLFRSVFRCMPDSQVTTWRDYHNCVDYAERFAHAQGMPKSTQKMQEEAKGLTGPPGHGASRLGQSAHKIAHGKAGTVATKIASIFTRPKNDVGKGRDEVPVQDHVNTMNDHLNGHYEEKQEDQQNTPPDRSHIDFNSPSTLRNREADTNNEKPQPENVRRKRATTKSSAMSENIPSKEDSEQILDMVQGALVEWPYDWLVHEEKGSKWLWPVDTVAPYEIYN